MAADFMRYYTGTTELQYLMVADLMRCYTRITIFHGCRFHEILQQNHNILWLQSSLDIIPEPEHLMVADFMRYYTKTTKSHGGSYKGQDQKILYFL